MSETDELGVWCRKCGSANLEVLDVRSRNDGIRRLHKCKRCGARLISLQRFECHTERKTIKDAYPTEIRKNPNR